MSDKSVTTATADAVNAAVEEVAAGKKFWMSRTFWANVVMAGAILLQSRYGFVIPLEVQTLIVSGVNLALRKITREPVTW
jgi:hypothetical protein